MQVERGNSTEAMTQMLKKRADYAGLDKPFTWHDFRRASAISRLEAGHNLVTVPKLMGHAPPVMTSIYYGRIEETKR